MGQTCKELMASSFGRWPGRSGNPVSLAAAEEAVIGKYSDNFVDL